jgi:glycosyltransferase involved in cell wall biosynthesis
MTTDAVGGVWTYAVDLARGLAERRIDTLLAVMGPAPSESQQHAVHDTPGVTIAHLPGRLEWMDDPWDDVRAAGDWLLDLERRFEPDVVHLNGYCHGHLPWSVPVMMVGHSCVASWWRAVKDERLPSRYDQYVESVRRGLAAADLVAAPSAAMLGALQEHYGPLRSACVIHNGRTPWPGHSGPTPSSLTQLKEPLVLTAGRLWDEAKNVRAVDEAAGRVSWPVFVAGDTGGVGGRVTFRHAQPLGRLSAAEMEDWMGRAAIYVLPARYEPFGLSVLEAAHSGCALVLGDIPSLREIWGKAALYVRPDDAEGLAAAVQRLAGDPRVRLDMAARARRRAERFTAARMVARYGAAYEALLVRARQRQLEAESAHFRALALS